MLFFLERGLDWGLKQSRPAFTIPSGGRPERKPENYFLMNSSHSWDSRIIPSVPLLKVWTIRQDRLLQQRQPRVPHAADPNARAVPMLDANGEIVEWFGTARDVTARKRTEEELRRLNATLEQTVQERTKELALQAEELRALAGELTLAEQRERQQIARALHDGLQQILVGARYRLNSAARSKDIPSELNKISGLIADAIETSRSLTAELNPTGLLQGDLVSSLE
jgi:signal transduction histidine kinase